MNNFTIIGSGSAYTPGIVNALIQKKDSLKLGKIVLIDDDEQRLKITGDFLSLYVKENAPEVDVVLTTDRKEAFTDMDFLLSQIRTGLLKQRILDETIPMKYDVIGQETCGPGGFAFAMREIPAMVSIAKDVVKYSPDAFILNYSNPTGIVAEAIQREVPSAKNICICDVPPWLQSDLAKYKNKVVSDFSFKYFGLNHLGWFTNMYDKNGIDVLPEIIEDIKSGKSLTKTSTDEHWAKVSKRQSNILNYFSRSFPVSYLQYYYCPDEMFLDEDPNYTRAQYCIDHREKETYDLCKLAVSKGTTKGCELEDVIHGDFIVDLADAIINNKKQPFIINCPNTGIIPNFSQDTIIECIAQIDATGYTPFNVGKIGTFEKGLMEVVKAYEILTVEACLEGSYEKALQALTLNPIVPSVSIAKKILDDYISVNKKYWPVLN